MGAGGRGHHRPPNGRPPYVGEQAHATSPLQERLHDVEDLQGPLVGADDHHVRGLERPLEGDGDAVATFAVADGPRLLRWFHRQQPLNPQPTGRGAVERDTERHVTTLTDAALGMGAIPSWFRQWRRS